jgi:hypothetical protein
MFQPPTHISRGIVNLNLTSGDWVGSMSPGYLDFRFWILDWKRGLICSPFLHYLPDSLLSPNLKSKIQNCSTEPEPIE